MLEKIQIPVGLCAIFACALSGCVASEDVQLETVQASLKKQAGSSCVSFYYSLRDEDGSLRGTGLDRGFGAGPFTPRFNGLPLSDEDGLPWSGAAGGGGYLLSHDYSAFASFCVPSGDYDISLDYEGEPVCYTGTLSLREGEDRAILVHGDPRAPTLSTFDVNDTPLDGQRRGRVSNIRTDEASVVVAFVDADGNEVANSGRVAYGQTWEGPVPETTAAFVLVGEADHPVHFVCGMEYVIGLVVSGSQGTDWKPIVEVEQSLDASKQEAAARHYPGLCLWD